MFSMLRRHQLLPILASVVACHSAQSLDVPSPNTQLEGNPRIVSVTRQDGSVFMVYRPTVRGDSLVGWLDNPRSDTSSAQRVAIALSGIRDVSHQKVDPTATAWWFGVAGLACVALFVIVFLSSGLAEGS